jgi:serine/threonine-protein kinase
VSAFRGDLDTIVLHAMRKEPARRYASVGELIEDVERYRRGLPIRARADTWSYRSGRFAARHRAAVVGSGVAAAVVVFALASWTAQRSRAGREAERAEQMESLFGDLFLFPNPRRDAGASVPSARDYVDRAVALVQRDLGDQPVSRGRLLAQLGRDYVSLGAYAPAEEILGQAFVIREQHFGAESTEAAETLAWLGRAQHYRGRYPQAEASLRRALRVQEQRLGADRYAPTSTAIDLGDLLHSRGQLAEAEELLRPVLERVQRRERLAGLLFGCRSTLANVLRDRGALGAAESLYVQAEAGAEPRADHAQLLIMKGDLAGAERVLVAELQRLRRDYRGEHPETAQCLRHLGHLRMEQGRLDEAEASLAEAQAMLARSLEAGHPLFARMRAAQAELARRQGRTQDAHRLARDALDRFERLGLAEHPAALDACHTLGLVLLDLGQPAAEPLGRCLAVARRLYVPGDPRGVALAQAHERALKAETASR